MKIRFRPEAEAKLGEAQSYLNGRGPGLGNRFVHEVRETVRRIVRAPTGSSFTVLPPYRKRVG